MMTKESMMENDDLERMYWFTVQDSAKLLTIPHIALDVFLADVFDSVTKLDPTNPTVIDLLAVLDELNTFMETKRANEAASEVFKA